MIPTPTQPLIVCESVDSTQLHAQRLRDTGSWADGSVLFHVSADYQHAGKGRFDRTWDAPTGTCSLVSTVVRIPTHALPAAAWFTALCALSICDTVEDLSPTLSTDLSISWPNDVLLGSKKLAGVLAQILPASTRTPQPNSVDLVLGAGINVSIPASHLPTPRATSLLAHGNCPCPDVSQVRKGYAGCLEERIGTLFASDFDTRPIREEFCARLTGLGSPVNATHFSRTSQESVSGIFSGIDDNGRALIATEAGVRAFASADMSLTCTSTSSHPELEA